MLRSPTYAEEFGWSDLGDVAVGRPNLGPEVPVAAYRLMQFAVRAILNRDLGPARADETLREAGRLAGMEFCRQLLDRTLPLAEFVAQTQQTLREQRLGIVRVEELDPESLRMVLVVAEDLECSGMPVSHEAICQYDEGFIAGVLEAYTSRRFVAREVECWASGGRVCRFEVNPLGDD
jgi:uncharacterized protein